MDMAGHQHPGDHPGMALAVTLIRDWVGVLTVLLMQPVAAATVVGLADAARQLVGWMHLVMAAAVAGLLLTEVINQVLVKTVL